MSFITYKLTIFEDLIVCNSIDSRNRNNLGVFVVGHVAVCGGNPTERDTRAKGLPSEGDTRFLM